MSTPYRLTTTIDSSALQSPHQKKSWAFVFDALNSTSCPLMLRVLDTIVFAKEPWRPKYWIFTDQDNFVRKRGISKLTVDDIVKACIQSLNLTTFSAEVLVLSTQLSQPKHSEQKVCFLVARRVRRLVNLLGLWNLRNADQDIELLQVYHIPGKPFDDYVYFHSFNSLSRSSTVTRRPLEALYSEESSCGEDAIVKRIEEDTIAVQGVMETHYACPIVFLKLSYLVERGMHYADARVPWLMFAEECIVGPSSRPRAIQLVTDHKPQFKSFPAPLAKPRPKSKSKIAPMNLHTHPDPSLSVVMLSSVHCPSFTPSLHKTTHEILAEIQSRKARYDLYKHKLIVKGEEREVLKRMGTSHSLVIPSVDLDRTEVSSGNEGNTSPPAPEPVDEEANLDQEVTQIDARQYLADPNAQFHSPMQELSAESLPAISEPAVISRNDTPEKRQAGERKLHSSLPLRSEGKKGTAQGKGMLQDMHRLSTSHSSVSLMEDQRTSSLLSVPCQGDFCTLRQVRGPQANSSKRFSVPLSLLQLAKNPDINPLFHPESLLPAEVVLATVAERDPRHSSKRACGGNWRRPGLTLTHAANGMRRKTHPDRFTRPQSRSLLQVPQPLARDQALVCARCFLVYESVRKRLQE